MFAFSNSSVWSSLPVDTLPNILNTGTVIDKEVALFAKLISAGITPVYTNLCIFDF
jgi:hypothetical protein